MYPRATYRLQFHKDFGFADAANIAPYLAELGISHVYASPYLKARPGSMHGYDIVAHDQLNPELGDLTAFTQMVEAFRQYGLQQILDIVPNHMGVGGADNPLWLDVLEWGKDSNYSGWFDIDWEPDHRYLHGKLLVPFLGNQYGVELDNGKLDLRFDADAGEFAVWAYDQHKLPICPLDYELILGDEHPELENLGDDFAALSEWQPQVARRAAELKSELAKLAAADNDVRQLLAATLNRINANSVVPAPRHELHRLIQKQRWRASHFRVAGDDINYRRFFNINDLAGLRVELPDVFEHSHRLIFQLLRSGIVDGLRVDHIDGLLDPKSYLERLNETATTCVRSRQPAAPRPYIVVEKILARGEELHADWPVCGTTGYEISDLLIGVLIDSAGEQPLSACYQHFTAEQLPFSELVRLSKIQIMNNDMASELNVIARDAARIARQSPRTADFTKNVLLRAIKEWVASFGVYRTYIDAKGELRSADRHYIEQALDLARANERDLDPSVFDFLQQLLCGDLITQRGGFVRHAVLRCAMKLQQYSGPVMAKGLEDTAFYRFNRLLALNDVGSRPDHFGLDIESFHQANLRRLENWPHSMLCTSTHDTKRGEDARTRLAALSELANEWSISVVKWQSQLMQSQPALSNELTCNDIYMVLQQIVATLPAELVGRSTTELNEQWQAYAQRLKKAIEKSLREAKQNSTWAAPNTSYEAAMMQFVDALLVPAERNHFHDSFFAFVQHVAELGVNNSLSMLALKLTLPGVPDTYQGAELWNLSMVDPDNRRHVDFSARDKMLGEIKAALQINRSQALRKHHKHWQSGAIKLAVMQLILEHRRARPEVFHSGSYQPCFAQGARQAEVIAFSRRYENNLIIVVASRFSSRRNNAADWQSTTLSIPREYGGFRWRNLLTGLLLDMSTKLPLSELLDPLPIAILVTADTDNELDL